MLISNSCRFIFIHLEKAAGTSIECALAPTLQWNDILLDSSPRGKMMLTYFLPQYGLNKHSSAKRVLDVIGEEAWNTYFTFTVVRNPFTRLASLYLFSQRCLRAKLLRRGLDPDRAETLRLSRHRPDVWPWNYPGVKAYMSAGPGPGRFSRFLRSPYLERWDELRQWSELSTGDGSRLLVNYVARVESLAQDWGAICERLGLGPLRLGHENRSTQGGEWRELFSSPEDVAFVRHRFLVDFEKFGYSLELPG